MPIINCLSIPVEKWPAETAPSLNIPLGADIWRVPVSSTNDQLEYFSSLLHPDELQKANRYHQEKDRIRYIVSRAALRIILSKYLQQLPTDIQITIGANKKPVLQNSKGNIHFNVSHSGNWILIVVGNFDIGVDVEQIDPRFSYEDIFPISFADVEADTIRKSPSPRKYFYRYWTRKEALAKASAKGLDDHFKNVPCLDGQHTVNAEIIPEVDGSWMVASFDVDEQHLGSVAYRHPGLSQNSSSVMLRWLQM